jgi:hypothetical protein
MRTIYFVFIVFLFAAFFHFACKDDVIPPNTNDDPGILRTDEFGNILGGDSTDWCWRGAFNGFSFGPVYPNPSYPVCIAQFYLPARDKVKLYILRSESDTIMLVNDTLNFGNYEFTINAATHNLVNTYQRLYIDCSFYNPSDSCRNYGDIKFEQ